MDKVRNDGLYLNSLLRMLLVMSRKCIGELGCGRRLKAEGEGLRELDLRCREKDWIVLVWVRNLYDGSRIIRIDLVVRDQVKSLSTKDS